MQIVNYFAATLYVLATPTMRKMYNDVVGKTWDELRWFLALHYKANTRLDTPFWKQCRAECDVSGIRAMLEFYEENGPTGLSRHFLERESGNFFGVEGFLVMLVGTRYPYRAQACGVGAGEADLESASRLNTRRSTNRYGYRRNAGVSPASGLAMEWRNLSSRHFLEVGSTAAARARELWKTQRAEARMIGSVRGAFRANFFSGFSRKRHINAAAVLVMVPHHLVDRAEPLPRARAISLAVLAGGVGVRLEGHVVPSRYFAVYSKPASSRLSSAPYISSP